MAKNKANKEPINNKLDVSYSYSDVGLREFENMLKGRMYYEAPEITGRICGMCSAAHTIAAVSAIEKAFSIKVTKQTKTLRNILLLSSIFRSHIFHLYFHSLPNYMGFSNSVDMIPEHLTEFKHALKLWQLSSRIIKIVSGREVHCITPVIGGFASIPSKDQVSVIIKGIKNAKDDAMKTSKIFSKLKYPKFERKTRYVSLNFQERFNFIDGTLIASNGVRTRQESYKKWLVETVNEQSLTRELWLKNKSFMVGALARLNNNLKSYSRNAKKAIKNSRIKFPSYNPYVNVFAKSVEIVHILDCLLELLLSMEIRDEKPLDAKAKKGTGISIIESPGGILIHEYDIDSKGVINRASIITPATMNLNSVNDDITELFPLLVEQHKNSSAILNEFKKLIGAYDPCISSSKHVIKVDNV